MVQTGRSAARAGTPRHGHPFLRSLKSQKELWFLSTLILVWAAIFCYYPMYGLSMAFFKYSPGKEIFESPFVGLSYFQAFLTKPVFWQLMRNTLAMSLMGLTVGFVFPILFAFSLNEIGNTTAKKLMQTASYLPHFISWVVAGAMVTTLLSSDGVVNDFLKSVGLTTRNRSPS